MKRLLTAGRTCDALAALWMLIEKFFEVDVPSVPGARGLGSDLSSVLPFM